MVSDVSLTNGLGVCRPYFDLGTLKSASASLLTKVVNISGSRP